VRHWWVNQNQTYDHEVPGGYLWSPVKRSDNAKNYFYDTMTHVRPGDVVLSFAKSHIKAIGIVTRQAEPSVKPDFGAAGHNWSEHGWLVQVEFQELANPLRPKDHMALLHPLLPSRYSPLSPAGNGYQHVYLTELHLDLATALLHMIGDQAGPALEQVPRMETPASVLETELADVLDALDLPETEKRQLVNARVGQGLFRNNVRLNEASCRITGVSEVQHLRASHIKPWKDSSNEERLHGCNGLLLAPHVDHLFDRGFISFDDTGDLLVSGGLEADILDAWSIEVPRNVGGFNADQQFFLAYHREQIFR
jgi:hypothetical protein